MSLRTLAKEVGVTASFLSQIERGLADPSLGTLRRIAKVLNVPIFEFLLENHKENIVVRRNERIQINLPDSPARYELLTPDLNRQMELFITELDPGSDNISTSLEHPTEECIYILHGTMKIQVADDTYVLEEGDSIYFKGLLLRSFEGIGPEKLVFISAITPPRF
ncbi:MAG: helix-turn-helix domain-containing protein [Chloroflexi bacterium]|nr:helix-turn-helix domain-containing protein [Chloroflexota bacterium]